MANFIGLVYATLKNEGIDTKDMSTDEAVKKYNELQKKAGGKAGEKEGTPAEQRRLQEKGIEKGKRAYEYDFSSNKTTPDEKPIAKYTDSNGMKYSIVQTPSGKYYNKYSEHSALIGPYSTEKEARDMMTKHRPNAVEDKVRDDSENWESGKYTGDDARFNKIHNAFSQGKVGERATKEMLSELGINEAGIKNFIITNELFNTEQNPDTVVKIARRIFNDGEYRK